MTSFNKRMSKQRIEQEREHRRLIRKKAESTGFFDSVGTLIKQNNSWMWQSEIKKLGDNMPVFDEDEEYKNRDNDRLMYSILSENNIERKYWEFISESQSKEELKHRVRLSSIHQELGQERLIGSSKAQNIFGAVGGRMTESDVLLSMIVPPVVAPVIAGIRGAGVAKTAVAVGLGANVARTEYEREDILQQGRLPGEVASDAIFGAVVDATLIGLLDFGGVSAIFGKMRKSKHEEKTQKLLPHKEKTQIAFDKQGQKALSHKERTQITFDKTSDMLKTINKDGADILRNNLAREGFEPEVLSYFRTSDDVAEAFDKANDALVALSRSEDKVKFMSAYQGAKKEFFEYIDTIKALGDAKFNKALSGLKKTVFRNDSLRPFDIPDLATLNKMKDEISNIEKTAGSVKKFATKKDSMRLDKRREWIKANEKELKSLKASIGKASKGSTEKEILESMYAKNKKKLDFHKKNEAKIIQEIKAKAIKDIDGLEDAVKGLAVTKDKKGNYFFGGKKLPLAMVAALIAAGQLQASSFGDGGSDDKTIFSYIPQIGALMLILAAGTFYGRTAARGIKNRYGSIANMIKGKKTEQYKALKEQQKNHRGMDELLNDTSMDEVRSNPIVRIIESVPTMRMKLKQSGDTGKKALKFIDNMFYDPLRGTSEPIAEHSVWRFYAAEKKIEQSKKELYRGWIKENDISILERAKTTFFDDSPEFTFEKEVAKAMDGLQLDETLKGQDHIRKYANTLSEVMNNERIVADGIGLKHSGSFVENYLPREMNHDFHDVLNAIRGSDDFSRRQMSSIKEVFTDMLHSGLAKKGFAPKSFEKLKTAKSIEDIKKLVKSNDMSGANALLKTLPEGQILDKIAEAKTLDEGLKLVDELEVAVKGIGSREYSAKVIDSYINDASNISSGSIEQARSADVFRSFKARLPLDLSKFKNIQIGLPNGEIKTLELSSVFNRDATALAKKYTRSLSGRIGLKNAGYEIEDVKKIIDDAPLTKQDKIGLTAYVNSLTGTQNYDMAGIAAVGSEAAGTALMTVQMSLVGFSFVFEALGTFSRMLNRSNEAKAIIKEFTRGITKTGKDSVFAKLLDEHGFASTTKRQTTGLRGEENLVQHEIGKGLTAALRSPRSAVFKYMGLNPFSDLSERLNMAATFDTLTKAANGKIKLTKQELKATGWNKSDEALFKKAFKINKEGYATELNYQSLSLKEKDRINTLHVAMNNRYAQRTHLGTSPSYAHTSHIGATLTTLMSWVGNSFANIGLRDGRGAIQGDLRSINMLVSALVGNYLSIKIRDDALGRDREEQQTMRYAVTSLPIFAPLEMMTAAATGGLPIFSYGDVTQKATKDLFGSASGVFE